ncbi:hypothetical protein D3C85_1562360 [compost metagenome]
MTDIDMGAFLVCGASHYPRTCKALSLIVGKNRVRVPPFGERAPVRSRAVVKIGLIKRIYVDFGPHPHINKVHMGSQVFRIETGTSVKKVPPIALNTCDTSLAIPCANV